MVDQVDHVNVHCSLIDPTDLTPIVKDVESE